MNMPLLMLTLSTSEVKHPGMPNLFHTKAQVSIMEQAPYLQHPLEINDFIFLRTVCL